MTKQKAIRLQTLDCDVYNKANHIRLVGGKMDGWHMHIEVAKQKYHLDLDIDESLLYTIENGELALIPAQT